MRTVFVDFDNTICPDGDESNPPSKDCLKTLEELRANNHRIIIYSVRSNSAQTNRKTGHQDMLDYLAKHAVPYDDVETSKVHFSLLIDDKALGCPRDSRKNINWREVRRLLELRDYL